MPFETEDEALAIANDVQYGLTGICLDERPDPRAAVLRTLEAGMIWVNSENVRHLPTPFGGVKASGIGRDGGDWSFEFYMEQKTHRLCDGAHTIPSWAA